MFVLILILVFGFVVVVAFFKKQPRKTLSHGSQNVAQGFARRFLKVRKISFEGSQNTKIVLHAKPLGKVRKMSGGGSQNHFGRFAKLLPKVRT